MEMIYIVDIFSKSQNESAYIKDIINKYELKYNILEVTKKL